MSAIVITITGRSGSGKTTLAHELKDCYAPGDVQIISGDSFYKDQSHMTMIRRVKTNYDHPSAIDFVLLHNTINLLKNNQPAKLPVYDFTSHTRSSKTIIAQPAKIIIVEGILTTIFSQIREIGDLHFYMDTDSDECFIRRLMRDTQERGRSVESIVTQYRATVKPGAIKYIDSQLNYADIVIKNNAYKINNIKSLIDDIKNTKNSNYAKSTDFNIPLSNEKTSRVASAKEINDTIKNPSLF